MEINGRHIAEQKGHPNWSVTVGKFTIRIDDATHPDFWLEIHLTPPEITRLLGNVSTLIKKPKETHMGDD